MGLGIPPLRINIMLESSPLKPTMLVGGLGVDSYLGPWGSDFRLCYMMCYPIDSYYDYT